jgi:glycosyltransferase involved in cell wall biosynthesis
MSTPTERILLFIPMYNCEPQIPRVIAQLTSEVQSLLSEVILVNNRSTDGGQDAAISALKALGGTLRKKLMCNDDNYGLGGSHTVALNYALEHGSDHVLVLHGDDQGKISDLIPLVRQGAHRDVDCLLGARFMRESKLTGYSTFRTLGNRAFNLLYSTIARSWIDDLGSGLNMYAVKSLAGRNYLRHANDLTFNYYMILSSIAAKQRLRFFPLEWREEDQISNVKIVRQSLQVARIARDYALARKRFLSADHSGRPSAQYTSTVIYDSAAP